MIPQDGSVVIDGVDAQGVNFSGLDPTISAIQWIDTFGWLEFYNDPATDIKPPNERITSLAPYQMYVMEAQTLISLSENPIVYYATVNGLLYGDDSYSFGAPIEITTPNTPQPANTTSLVPPTPEDFQQLWWYANNWVISPVDPTLDLLTAQQQLIKRAQQSAAMNVNIQSSIYSFLTLSVNPDPNSLPCADSPSTTLGTYQTLMDSRLGSKINSINAATQTSDLYYLDPSISPAFS